LYAREREREIHAPSERPCATITKIFQFEKKGEQMKKYHLIVSPGETCSWAYIAIASSFSRCVSVCVPRFLFKNKTQRTSIKTALQMCVLSTTRMSDVTTGENKRKSRSEKQQKKKTKKKQRDARRRTNN
jgi:hypothetical protein